MRYLQTYALFESIPPEHPLLQAMQTAPGGLDLGALSTSFRVDRTGKLVIKGLRGRTYVQQQPDGTWKHWTLATGQVYGTGVYATLDECLAGCWMELVLNSQSFRPKGMRIETYQNLISSNLSALQGKGFKKDELRQQILDLIGQDFNHQIQNAKDFYDLPKWRPTLEILGFSPKNDSNEIILFGSDSVIINLFLSSKELSKDFSLFPGDFNSYSNLVETCIRIDVKPWEVLKIQDYTFNTTALTIGGDISTLPAFADKVWGSKKFHTKLTDSFRKEISGRGLSQDLKQRLFTMRQVGVQLLQKVAGGGTRGDLISILLPIMQDRNFSPSEAGRINELMPELWQAYVAAHPDPDSVRLSPLLGNFFDI